MHTLGLLAGEGDPSTLLYEQEIANAREDGGDCAVLVERAHQPALRAALAAQDDATAERVLREAAARLRAAGATRLVLCSFGLHRFADALEDPGAPLLRIEDAIGAELLAQGAYQAGFVSRSEAYLRPELCNRIYAEHGILLLPVGEDGAEEIDAAYELLDRGTQPTHPPAFWQRIGRKWSGGLTNLIVFEREALAWHVTRRVPFPHPTLSIDKIHAQACWRYTMGQEPPQPRGLNLPPYIPDPNDR